MRAGTRPHWQGARASERAHVLGSIWLLLAQKTCEMKTFTGTQALFDVCVQCARASHAGACHAPAAVRVGQCKARRLSSPAMGQLKAVVNGAAACSAVGVKA